MKTSRSPMRLAFVVAAVAVAVPAHATQYWDDAALMGAFFKPDGFRFHTVTLSDEDAADIGKKLGVALPKKTWNVYIDDVNGQKRTGFAILDHEVGLHEPIDFGVKFGPSAAVERVEIRAYREPYGDEVRGERFRKQFIGKTANDTLVAGKDVDIISGATYSSKAMTLGVKRDALVLQAALKNGL